MYKRLSSAVTFHLRKLLSIADFYLIYKPREALKSKPRLVGYTAAATAMVLLVLVVNKTGFGTGYWGIGRDEIAIITVEREENSEKRINETIAVVDPGKSIWDGLQLIGVPLILVILGAWFRNSQQKQAERTARNQRKQDADEAREEVLQLFFDRVSALLIDRNLMAIVRKTRKQDSFGKNSIVLIEPEKISNSELSILEASRDIIRARTLSILRRFESDVERKSSVVRFLVETEVISSLRVDLSSANISQAELSGVDLSRCRLSGANLDRADLTQARFANSELVGASLVGAGLVGANLTTTDLTAADLKQAHLGAADLSKADLTGTDLRESFLFGTLFIDAFINGTDFSNANLSQANFAGTKIVDADFTGASLKGANLAGANLFNANLAEADLTDVIFDQTTIWPPNHKTTEVRYDPIMLRNDADT